LVTIYAVGSLISAIPLMVFTQGIRRRPLLLTSIFGFLVANSVTAVSANYSMTLIARFVAGVSAGLLWALIAGYATRMAPENLKGRAITIAMAGTPLALSLGVPAGTFLGSLMGWRACFGLMSVLTVLLVFWILAAVPDFSGKSAETRQSLKNALKRPGVLTVFLVMFAFVLAHNILYTYIAPFLANVGMQARTDTVLLVFGLASLISIWIVGALIDGRLRLLTLASTLLFGLAAVVLWLWGNNWLAIYGAATAWGLAFGGCATLFQTASANAAGPVADLAQSILVTVWNAAIAGGSFVGGVLLETMGANAFAPSLIILILLAYLATFLSRQHGFPAQLDRENG
jgi:predicted MFS family arabinose efflux permease